MLLESQHIKKLSIQKQKPNTIYLKTHKRPADTYHYTYWIIYLLLLLPVTSDLSRPCPALPARVTSSLLYCFYNPSITQSLHSSIWYFTLSAAWRGEARQEGLNRRGVGEGGGGRGVEGGGAGASSIIIHQANDASFITIALTLRFSSLHTCWLCICVTFHTSCFR